MGRKCCGQFDGKLTIKAARKKYIRLIIIDRRKDIYYFVLIFANYILSQECVCIKSGKMMGFWACRVEIEKLTSKKKRKRERGKRMR